MQLPLALAQRHYNRQLFADRYLDVTLPQRPEWLALADEATPILAALRTIFAAYTPSSSEAQTEKDLVHPVLNALGHTYEIQTPLRTPKGTKKPDYIFYNGQAALTQNKGRTLSAADLAAAFAVGDAKHWERKLDVSSTRDYAEINKVPADQIAFYLRHSGVAWGLLTNGRRWRLYHRDSFERQDRYYEVDLKDLVEANDPIAFLYFYAFFRRAAFDPPQAHPLTLATMLRESADYAQGVSASLKEQVYDALRHMAQGFLDYPRNKLDPTPATLQAIYANSLIVLYRLLFVLYAEARELLPLRASADYREEYSLYAVVREAARRLDSGMTLLVDTGRTWAKLRDLFGIINVGSPPLNVATFNGGLFDPQRHPFLEQYVVGDAQLQQALDNLARVADSAGLKELIDYRDLAERHLGTIYEGLLEYRLVGLGPHPPNPLLTQEAHGELVERIVIPADLQATMVEVARRFRKEPTPSDAVLWQALRKRQLEQRKFRRQQPIGPFVVDFFCSEERLIVEVDGPIHATQQEADHERQQLLEQAGYRMLRVSAALVEHDLPQALQNIRIAFTSTLARLPSPVQDIPSPKTAPEPSPQTPLPERERGFAQHQDDEFAAPPPAPREGEGGRGDAGESLPRTPADAGFTIALVNDKGERHRTGSYYTPDFVVQYIVEQTLQPILDAAVAAAANDDAAQIAAVLSVNVLDPAMGSGHFPVAAMEYIARYLVDLGVTPPAEAGDEPDLAYWKRRVAQSCIYGVDLNPLAVDLAKLSLWLATAAKGRPLSFLDHHLRCGNALVGTRVSDLDGLRLAAQKPRRRPARLPASIQGEPSSVVQISLLDDAAFAGAMSSAVGSMWLIEGSAASNVAEVKEQEQLYEQVRRSLTERFAVEADLRTAAGFGQAPEPSLWKALTAYAIRRDTGAFAMPAYEPLLQQMRELAAAQRFFHWDLEFPEVFFDRHGRPLGDSAGFDAVIGNPPYVRQEQLGPVKPYFQAAFAETYHGMNDLYVYFYQQGVRLLQAGGRMSYIVTNKWLRAGYGEGLRGFFAEQTQIERIVDFGHAPIFAGADVFPCIIVVQKPVRRPSPAQDSVVQKPARLPSPVQGAGRGGEGGLGSERDAEDDQTVQVTNFPREALKLVSLASYVNRYSYPVPQRRLGRSAWSLEAANTDDLMEKIRRNGVPLAEFAGVKPYYGIKTGFNEAFLIDTATKERLVRDDPRSAAIIKPYLRGQDIKRWSPEWDGLWLIQLKSSGDYTWPWSSTPEQAEAVFAQTYPSLYAFMKPFEARLRQRQDKGRFWWELRSCAYYAAFDQPKLMYQEIQFHPVYSMDDTGYFCNNKVFFLAKSDPYLLAVLNSPLMWWHNWRFLPHMKDEALNPAGFLIEQLPIAPPSDTTRAEVEPAVARLIAITQANQAARRDTLDWLGVEFGVEKAGQKLEAFAGLSEAAFIEEVRKRRPKAAGSLSPAGLRALRDGYVEQATPVQQRAAEALGLEQRLAALVNAAYGLTPEAEAVLWETAPPRMPIPRSTA